MARALALVGAVLLLLAGPWVLGGAATAQEADSAAESTPAATADSAAETSKTLEEVLDEAEELGYEVSIGAPTPPTPPAPETIEKHRIRKDTQVVFGSSVRVEENEVARDVVAIGGSVYIDGEARGDAVAVGGSATVEGEVSGSVTAIGGTVRLGPNARVMGDVVSVGGTVEYEEGAEIHGEVVEVPFGSGINIGAPGVGFSDFDWDAHGHWPFFAVIGVIWSLVSLGVLFLLAALILLLVRTPVERVAYKAASDPWRSGLVGLLSQILFLPLLVILVLVLCISIIGIPLLLLLPFALLALLVMSLLGYTGVAYLMGRWAEKRFGWRLSSPFVALLIGVLLIEIWSLCGEALGAGGSFLWFFAVMFGLLGFLAEYLAWTVGFGAALMTRFGTLGPTGDVEPERAPAAASDAAGLDEWQPDPSPVEEPQAPGSDRPERGDDI